MQKHNNRSNFSGNGLGNKEVSDVIIIIQIQNQKHKNS